MPLQKCDTKELGINLLEIIIWRGKATVFHENGSPPLSHHGLSSWALANRQGKAWFFPPFRHRKSFFVNGDGELQFTRGEAGFTQQGRSCAFHSFQNHLEPDIVIPAGDQKMDLCLWRVHTYCLAWVMLSRHWIKPIFTNPYSQQPCKVD